MDKAQVILADDHQLVRAGMRMLLEKIAGITVIGEASNGREALRLVQEHRPALALVDITMPELNGLEAAAQIARDYPETRVIILSMHAHEEYAMQAIRAGAVGYLVKDAAITELELAVRAALNGETYLSPSISSRVINFIQRQGSNEAVEKLTERQREVLQLIAEGQSTQHISEKLNISIKTVETHRAQIMERLDIHDIPGLVRYAIRTGLIQAE